MKSTTDSEKTRRYTQGARAQSTEATAQRIVEAFLARLMRDWFDEITLAAVAEDAGVTVQTVVRRFGGKEGLLTEAVKLLTVQINARREAPKGDVPRLLAALMSDYETSGDAVIRLLALEPRHEALKTMLNYGRGQHRGWVSRAFAAALADLDAAARRRAVDALMVVTDVYSWKLLRRDMGHSQPVATAMMTRLVGAVLADISKQPE